jgi:hypothetical protein
VLLVGVCILSPLLLVTPGRTAAAPGTVSPLSEAARLKHSGQRELALARARQALRLAPGDREAHWIAAWTLAELGRQAEAVREFGAFALAAPGDPRLPEVRAALKRLGAPVSATTPAPRPARPVAPAPPAKPAVVPAKPAVVPAKPPVVPAKPVVVPAKPVVVPAKPAVVPAKPAVVPAKPVVVPAKPVVVPANPVVVPPKPVVAPAEPAVAPAIPAAQAGGDQGALEALLATAPVKGAPERLGGGVMVKYKLRLVDGSPKGQKAVFKPHQKSPQSYVYEVVAYRISKLCRMGFVPVTVKRDLPRSLLAPVEGGGFARVLCSGDRVTGSLQEWVKDASDPFGMGARAWATGWLARLASPSTPVPDRAVARQISSMFVLDYLQGNGDRYTGGNILQDAAGKYWFIDNSEGFSSNSQPRRDFDRLVRFDRTVIGALRAATPAQISAEMGGLLTKAELRGLLDRRQHALARVDAAVRRYGAGKAYL